ncbi:MAG: glutamate racemase [Firmicutes bacterium]|nr:glutamate racemase [Bacillota bacterium]
MKDLAIGVFDSGVGGLTVASEIMKQMPYEKIYYYADTARVPYGEKTPDEIKGFVNEIIAFLLGEGVKAVIMACNTSSALALTETRKKFDIPVIGVIEPAVLMALSQTREKRIGVIANLATTNSGAYKNKFLENGNGVSVFQQACPMLVPLVERGIVDGEDVKIVLKSYLEPLKAQKIDTLILGCTHYPYLMKPIEEIMGDGVKIVNPAYQAVKDMKSMLEEKNLLSGRGEPPEHKYFVSGERQSFMKTAEKLLGRKL